MYDYIFGVEELEFLVGSHNKIKKPAGKRIKSFKRSRSLKTYLMQFYYNYTTSDSYKEDTYWRAAIKYNIKQIAQDIGVSRAKKSGGNVPEVVIYGEIIGPGIQKGYDYGVEQGIHELRVFDIMIDGQYQDWDTIVSLCEKYELTPVDELYRGPWSLELTSMCDATDVFNGKQFLREGVVIRPLKERWSPKCGRVIMKYLNPKYELDKTNSEYH
jgi:RNA ligase (TIGR02306 family)